MARTTTRRKAPKLRRKAAQPDVDAEGIQGQVTSQGEGLAMPSTKPRRESEDADAEDQDESGDASPSEDEFGGFDDEEDEGDDFEEDEGDDFEEDEDDDDVEGDDVEGDDVEDEPPVADDFEEESKDEVPTPAPPPESAEGKALRLIGAMVTITEILEPDRLNKLREVCPPGELSDSMDAAIRPACVNLDRLMRKWVNGRP